MAAPLPPVPPLPLPTKPTAAWWITTLAGCLIPIAIGVAAYLPTPYGPILLSVAGALGAALGVSHTGVVTPPAKG